jgi:hypothetical protein
MTMVITSLRLKTKIGAYDCAKNVTLSIIFSHTSLSLIASIITHVRKKNYTDDIAATVLIK